GSVSRGPSFLSVEARIVESESGRVLSASSGRVPLEEADPGPVPPPGRSAQAGQPRLPRAVGAPAVAVMGGRVYVAGGTARGSPSGTGVTEVLSAPIDGRGRVGAWRQEEPLPSARYQTVGAAADGAVFVIGGYQGSPRDEVFVSLASSEGRLGPWRTAGRLPAGGSGCKAFVAARTLFVGGCAAASGTDARVHAAVLRGDAALGPWTSVAQPAPAHSAAMVHAAGRLYLLGGSTGVPPRTAAVHSIAVRPGGFDGEFRDEEPMPAAAQHNGAAVVGGRLYSAGGITGDPGAASADVFSAAIDGEGRLRGWRRELRRLPAPRIPGPMPVWDGRGYLVSDFGSISDEVTVVPDDLVAVPPAGFGTLPSSP
ncbi:MAG: hypothetical protein HYV15_02740, partial [Elusimicrobia bacterium]|nr:hypothetical protein [Elusimicrobiota bacterium]